MFVFLNKVLFVIIVMSYSVCAYADTIVYGSKIGVNSSNNTVTIWESYDTVSSVTTIMAAYSTDGIIWGTAQAISQTDTNCILPEMFIDVNGHVVVVWVALDTVTGNEFIYGAMYNAISATWNAYELIAPLYDTFHVNMHPNGNIAFTFTDLNLGLSVIKTSYATCGTPGWSTPVIISP